MSASHNSITTAPAVTVEQSATMVGFADVELLGLRIRAAIHEGRGGRWIELPCEALDRDGRGVILEFADPGVRNCFVQKVVEALAFADVGAHD